MSVVKRRRQSVNRRRWVAELREKREIRRSLERGIADAAAGRTRDLGSFVQFADTESGPEERA